MNITRMITAIPMNMVHNYIGRKVLGYIVQEDRVLTNTSDILNSKYPVLRMVEGTLVECSYDGFRKNFIVKTEDGSYECDFIRIFEKEVPVKTKSQNEITINRLQKVLEEEIDYLNGTLDQLEGYDYKSGEFGKTFLDNFIYEDTEGNKFELEVELTASVYPLENIYDVAIAAYSDDFDVEDLEATIKDFGTKGATIVSEKKLPADFSKFLLKVIN